MINFLKKKIPGILVIIVGVILFGLLINKQGYGRIFAFGILIFLSIIIGYISRDERLLVSFGLTRIVKSKLLYLAVSLTIGIGLGMIVRLVFDLSLLPKKLTWIALLVPFVGITEELIFRGFIQGHLKPLGRIFAILISTTGHTMYKGVLILGLGAAGQFNVQFLMIWTFLGGLVFGILREQSKSVIPPAIAHGIFDIVLYGGFAALPFWVLG